MKYCNFCSHAIDWVKKKSDGRYIAVDPAPVFIVPGDGNHNFFSEDGELIQGRLARPEETATLSQRMELETAFMPHWRTCGKKRR